MSAAEAAFAIFLRELAADPRRVRRLQRERASITTNPRRPAGN